MAARFNKNIAISGIADTTFEEGHDILDEEMFKRVLCRERRHAERSGESIILLLLDFTEITETEREHLSAAVAGALLCAIRQTDECGWLKRSELMGVVFTDIQRQTVKQALQTVEAKVRGCVKTKIPQSMIKRPRISVLVFPDDHDRREEKEWFNPLFYPEGYPDGTASRAAKAGKRFMDLAGSLLAILLFSPIFLTVAVLIKLTSPGPVLFRQVRIGQHGRPFEFLKFRSMRVNNDDSIHREFIRKLIVEKMQRDPSSGDEEAVFKIRHDPRVTPIGNFLRRSSLDELPQLFNVLRGDMSLVGPRPPIPYEVEDYSPWHRARLFLRTPGITGLWQVNGRSRTTFDEMVRLDLRYSRTWSLWLDIKLLLATPMAVIRGKGAS